jgi:hypothetical protein
MPTNNCPKSPIWRFIAVIWTWHKPENYLCYQARGPRRSLIYIPHLKTKQTRTKLSLFLSPPLPFHYFCQFQEHQHSRKYMLIKWTGSKKDLSSFTKQIMAVPSHGSVISRPIWITNCFAQFHKHWLVFVFHIRSLRDITICSCYAHF